MQEKLEHRKLTTGQGILYVLLLVIGIVAVYFVVGFIVYLLKLPILTYIMYVGLIVGATVLMKVRLQDYTYQLDGKTFSIFRNMGSKEKKLVEAPLKNILWMGPLKEVPGEYERVRVAKLTFLKERRKAIIYREGKLKRGAIFSPSSEFFMALQEKWKTSTGQNAEKNEKTQMSSEDATQ